MAKNFKSTILLQEIFFFAATGILAVLTAKTAPAVPVAAGADLSAAGIAWWEFLLFFSVATTVFLLFGKFFRRLWPLRVLFLTALFFGALISLGAFFGAAAAPLAAALIAVYAARPFLLLHNAVLTLALAGVAASLGSALTPPAAIVVLASLSVYDVVAVHFTWHMVAMLREMLSAGAVFAMIFPRDWQNYGKAPRREMRQAGERAETAPAADFAMLGSGDFVFPAALAVSALSSSGAAAWTVLVFSLAGLAAMHFLFISRGVSRPMAALPPLAAFAIFGYFAARFLGF